MDNPIILFDGVCNFCSSSVQFVIKRDPKGIFRFCQLQSSQGKVILDRYDSHDQGLTSVILVQNGKVYKKSSAALRVAAKLNKAWPLLTVFYIIPCYFRDWIYDFIGNHRYAWFGKKATCWIPDAEINKRFLDQ